MPAPNPKQLQPQLLALLQQRGLQGEKLPALAEALASTIGQSLALLAAQARVAPGISCSPAASLSPGRLL
jgi:hypothetical protein